MERIKVFNNNKFDVGVRLMDRPLGVNIKAGSFLLMSEDDIAYNMSINSLFQRGLLRVEEKAEEVFAANGIDVNNDPNFVDDTEIEKKLNLSAKKLEEWLNTVTEGHILDRVYDIAMEKNLNMTKLAVLQKKMPDRNFIGEV